MGESIRLSISVLLVFSVLWKAAYSEDKCSLACTGSPTAPTFLSGHKYNYGVEGTVSVYLTGANKQETGVKLLGQVTVTSLGNCVNELKVQNLVISGPDGKKYSSPPGVDKPVRFTLEDGRIGPDLCAEEGDTRRALNIKRAIISLLQTEKKSAIQVDVFGTCPTEASSSQEGSAVLVHRTRDLSRCGHREQGKNDLLTGIYNPTAEIKNTQVLQSTLNVESKVNNGIPEKVAATEEYLYKPFSVGENGARAKVHTKLTLTGKSAGGAAGGQCDVKRTVIFENPHGAKASGNSDSALAAVKDTANTLGSEASSKSAGEFAQLVRILRTVSKEDLMKVYGQVKGNGLQKRVFLDGLLRAGTGYSVEASIEILKGKDLSDLERKLVFLSLGNAKHVNNEALKAAATLLDTPHLPQEIYLGVGALAGSYCRDHNCHQIKSEGIAALSQKLAAKLQNCKPKNKIEEDNVVAVLKGIRNIRHLEDNLIDRLVRCANDNNVKARVRVTALEAFGADSCSAKLKKAALDLMKNRQLDSEIRIKAYLAVIQCPCGGSANEIKNLLESEPVHQVGRFITSSLRFIRSSANPDKALAKHHYGLINTPNRFNVDDRKYSFYRELSYNVDALGVGGSAEQTVIYSQDSFLPRSASLNLTAEVFGHSLNVLEVGGRQGNLDRVAEQFFGPKSIFRTQKPQDIYDNFVNRFTELEKKAEGGLSRGRRSVKTEIDNFDKHLKAESAPYNYELDLDLDLKLFGTDAVFLSLGDDKGINLDALVDRMVKVVSGGLNQAKHFQQEVRAHLLFLDAELSYPTSTGLALKLDLIGSATGRLEVATNLDIRQIYRNPKNAKFDVKLIPSTDIEIAGLFLVDADAVATGLKVVTNLHSSTGSHFILKVLEDGRGFDLQLSLPLDKQEILTATNDLVYFTAEKGQKEKYIALKVDIDKKEYAACFDQLSGVLGLSLCLEASVPFSVSGPDAQASISKFIARYPLTGSSKVKVVLEKNDLRGYHVKGILRTDNEEKKGFELLFEAEGAKNRRTSLSGELIRTSEEKTLKLALESPIKSVSGQLSYYHKSNEQVLYAKANIDKEEYYAKAGFAVQGNARQAIYKPLVEYSLPGDKQKHSLKVDGQVKRDTNGPAVKYTFEGIKITIPSSNEVVDVNGHYAQDPKGAELDLKAKKGEHNLMLSGSLKGHDVKVEFQNTLNPNINFKVNGHFENAPRSYHNDIELFYGMQLNNPSSRVNFNQLLKYDYKSHESFNIITKNKFEIHALPIKVKFDAEADPKKLDVEIGFQYMEKIGDFDLEARTHIKKPGDYSVKIAAEFDKKGLEVFAKRDVESADKSNFENYVTVKGVAKYELSGVVLHKTKPNDLHVGANGHLKISGGGKEEDIKFDVGAIENANLYSSHAKISGSKGNVVDYLLKITRGANPSGQLKFNLQDKIAANGQFKVTDNDGRGNGMIIVDFKKTQRKIKGDMKFLAKDPVFNAELDLFLNHEKDDNDKIHFSTNTKRTAKNVESKNKLEYGGKKTEVNYHRDGPVFNTGKSTVNVEVVLPSERCLNLKLDQDINIKDDVVNGHTQYSLSDAAKSGDQASTISFKSKIVDTNFEKEAINVEGELGFKLTSGKYLQHTFALKNIPDGEKYKYDYKGDLKSSWTQKRASLSASGEGANAITVGNDKYKFKGDFGDDMGFELVGFLDYSIAEKTDKKYQKEFTLTLRAPLSNERYDVKLGSNVLYIQPENKNFIAEYTVMESVQVNSNLYKVDASGKLGLKEGFSKVKVLVPHVDPQTLEVSYKLDPDSDKKRASVEVKSAYGKGKTGTVNVVALVAPQEYELQVQADVPHIEQVEKVDLKISAKNPAPGSYSSLATLNFGKQSYSYDAVAVFSKVNPVVDIKYNLQNAPPSRIYIKGNALSSTQGKLEVKLENIHKDISLDASSEVNIQKDNVAIKFLANSEKLGFKNYKVDITSKDAGSGKRLEFHATNDNKNVLSGSTSFISKQEGTKTLIEGSGSVKVKEEQKSANFKYIRTVLSEGNEQGVETFLNLAIGERSYVAESRVTNLEFKNSYVYCEEKKQCANVDLQSKINMPNSGTLQHIVNVGFDLRKLGVAPEFGLLVSNEVSEKKLPQYSLDLHVNNEDKKYYLHMYSNPEIGKFPAGITITLPKRVLALESQVTYASQKSLPFPIQGELTFHLDKNKPKSKTAARFKVDVTGNEKQHTGLAEFGFSHPSLNKEATLKFRANVQHPNEKSLKVDYLASLSLSGLNKDRECKVNFEISPSAVKLLVQTPIVKLIDLEGSATVKENLQEGTLQFTLLEGKPVLVRGVVKDYQYYEFATGYQNEAERKLSIIGHIEPDKKIYISADIILPNQKKNIAHGAILLQDSTVKTDYGMSADNFKYFVNALQNDLKNLVQRIKELGVKATEYCEHTCKELAPTYKKLQEAIKADASELYQEARNDLAFMNIFDVGQSILAHVLSMVQEVIEAFKPLVNKLSSTASDLTKNIKEIFEKLEPKIQKLCDELSALITQCFEGVLDVVAHYAAIFESFYDKHKPELQELTNSLTEIFKSLTRLLVAQVKEYRGRVGEIFANLSEQIKELPFVGFIKEKWQELAVPDQVIGLLQQLQSAVTGLLPTDETRAFADALFNYVQKKLRQEKIDDSVELRVVYEKLVVALTSVVQLVRGQLNQLGVPTFFNINALSLISGPGHVTAPSLGGVASFNLINRLFKGDFPDPLAIIRAYRPRSLYPLEEVPAKLRGVVVNGQHIFTFDGRHLTFPGKCRYVLVHDHVDRNFTLVLQLDNGAPKAIVLEDKSGTVVEIKDNGQVTVNGAAHGFPVLEKDVFAFREPSGRLGLGSTYGLTVFCSPNKLAVCYVEVSGFYLGKLRGLLGDGNNEPYDDFRMPNGKITNSESEFGNSYRLASTCPQVKTPEHSHHQHHSAMPGPCEQVFGSSSTLRPLSLFLDVAPFRQACIHAVTGDSANGLQQACDIGRGYLALALTGLLPAVLPQACLQCTDTDQPKSIGDTYEIKLPQKQADIIVSVEVTKSNEKNYKDLVVPLVSQLVDSLKSKHITDIKIYLVGITSKMPYPILYDTDLKLKSAKVQFDDESRYQRTPMVVTNNEKIDKASVGLVSLVDQFRVKLGLTNVVAGYHSILSLPLRPGAVKHTINVVGEYCQSSFFLVEFLRAVSYGALLDQMAYTHTLVTITPDLKIGGGKNPSQVVGFTEESVLLLGDKKQTKDSEALRATLELVEDACIDFVESTDGIVLSASHFHALNPGQQKQFLQTSTAAITNKLLGKTLVQECTCGYVDAFRARSLCLNKERKETGRRRK